MIEAVTDGSKVQLREQGYCVIEDVLNKGQVQNIRRRLVAAAAESEKRGIPTYIRGLDPNPNNVRVFNLLDLDPCFLNLI